MSSDSTVTIALDRRFLRLTPDMLPEKPLVEVKGRGPAPWLME